MSAAEELIKFHNEYRRAKRRHLKGKITADEALEARKHYKRAKKHYYACKNTVPQPEPAPVKQRKPRDPNRPRSEKEKANDARLRAQIALAREIRAENPNVTWTAAIKQAAEQMKK